MPLTITELSVREAFVPRPGCAFLDADITGLEGVTLAQVEIWLLGDHRKADKINADVDLLSETGAAIAGLPYEVFMTRARGIGMPKDSAMAHIRNVSKVPCYGKPGGMADKTLVGFARTSYGMKLGATSANPRPSKEQMEAEAVRIGTHWRRAAPFDQDYLERMRGCRGQDGLYHVIIGHPSIGTIIRRGRATYCAACNSPFQGLGALAAGEITWEIQKACYATPSSPLFGCRLVVHAYDQWVVECPIPRVTEAALELQRIIETMGARKVPDVKLKAPAAASCTWNKSAEPVWTDDGRLLIWGTEECNDHLERKKAA